MLAAHVHKVCYCRLTLCLRRLCAVDVLHDGGQLQRDTSFPVLNEFCSRSDNQRTPNIIMSLAHSDRCWIFLWWYHDMIMYREKKHLAHRCLCVNYDSSIAGWLKEQACIDMNALLYSVPVILGWSWLKIEVDFTHAIFRTLRMSRHWLLVQWLLCCLDRLYL